MFKKRMFLSVLLILCVAFTSVSLFVGCGNNEEQKKTITYNASTLADATVGENYTGTVASAKGANNIKYALKEGDRLPDGMTVSQTGRLSGIPTSVAENFKFTIVASADGAIGAEAEFTINVLKPQIRYRGSIMSDATVGEEYKYSVATASNADDITYTLAEESVLPAGLTLFPSGEISGTPTEAAEDVVFEVVASADGFDPVSAEFRLSIYYPAFIFQAEWGYGTDNGEGVQSGAMYSPAKNGSGGNGYIDFIGDKAEFTSVKIDFTSDKAGDAKLVFGMGLNSGEYTLDQCYNIKLNGETVESQSEVPASTGGAGVAWYDWNPIRVGDVKLKEGLNSLEIIGGEVTLCLDYVRIEVMDEQKLTWYNCTDVYDGTENFRLSKSNVEALGKIFGDGYTVTEVYDMNEFIGKTICAADGRTNIADSLGDLTFGDYELKVTASKDGETRSMIVPVTMVVADTMFTFEAEDGVIADGEDRDGNIAQPTTGYGQGAKGEYSGYVDFHGGGSVTFKVNANAEATVKLILRFGRVSETHTMSDIYVIKVNGVLVDCGSMDVPTVAGGRPWYDWYDMVVGEVSLTSGENTIEVIAADNPLILDNISFASDTDGIELS